jgi:hypothetical protein
MAGSPLIGNEDDYAAGFLQRLGVTQEDAKAVVVQALELRYFARCRRGEREKIHAPIVDGTEQPVA